MTYHKSKHQITKAILAELPHTSWHELPLDDVVFRWWVTGRGGEGLRLSEEGIGAFVQAKIEYYEFPLGSLWNKKDKFLKPELITHELSKKIKCPFYLGVNKDGDKKGPYVRIFDSKIAMVVTLYGNIRDYLNSIR
jgi:hypothetical protein